MSGRDDKGFAVLLDLPMVLQVIENDRYKLTIALKDEVEIEVEWSRQGLQLVTGTSFTMQYDVHAKEEL